MHRFSLVRSTVLWLIMIFMSGSYIYGQSFSINYTAKDGLENENINAIAEDYNGYIYVASSSGVMLFDGVSFIPFYKSGTGDIPENVFVFDLVFDQLNNLWIRSELDGIYHWDRSKDHWTNFSISSDQEHQIESNELSGIASIDSFFYFSCQRLGLSTINIYNLSISTQVDNSKNTYSDIDTLGGKLILSGYRNIYSLENGDLNSIARSKQYSLVDTELSEGMVFTTKYESGAFISNNGDLQSLEIDKVADPWRTRIIGIMNGELLLTTRNSGLVKYNIQNKTNVLIKSKRYDYNSLLKAKYNGGLIDSRGIVWVATSKGVSCFNPKLQGFLKIDNKPEITDYILDAGYHEKSKNYITLFASSADKVKIYAPDFRLKSGHDHTPNVEGVRSIFDLMQYKDMVYAISHELLKIDPNTGKCTAQSDIFSLPKSGNRTANIDNEGNLWCIHGRNILTVYNIDTGQKLIEKPLPLIGGSSPRRYNMNKIHFDEQYAYIAAESIFLSISKNDYEIQIFNIEFGLPKNISAHPSGDNKIKKVLPHQNYIYISSRNDGIFKTKFNPSDSSFEVINHLTTKDLYSPLDFEFDDQDNMWVATDNGLALLDDELRVIKKYNSQNGLPNTKLTTGISIANNKIFLKGDAGIVVGFPDLLRVMDAPQKVDISLFEVNGESYPTSGIELKFPYTQKNISLHLSMPIYGTNSDYKYHYRLRGNNDEWKIRTIDKNEFSYDNLNPGSYTFEVKSIVGQNESEISKVQFEINPPFWKTGYFLFLIIGITTILFTLFYKYRVKKKVEKERINTLLSQLENTAIRSQLNPHFIFNSLNSIRSMILLDRKQDSVQYLEQFSDMVREVLQMSKEEKVTLDHEIAFNKNYLEIEKLRFSDKFIYEFKIENGLNTKHILVPPLIIQPFVENAIWHGLLHNKKESTLNVVIKSQEDCLHIIIDDNGVGREKSRVLQRSSIKKTKRNLGVSLSRQRISMLGKNANVKIIDKYDQNTPIGTTVHIIIPLTYEG